MRHRVEFIDRGVEPENPSDPKYPNGIDIVPVDVARYARTCRVALEPYPAPRCGYLAVVCETCKTNALVTVTGRPDDPRSITLICHGGRMAVQTEKKPHQ